jgi:predicted DNA-binding transcriptional regulator YafY
MNRIDRLTAMLIQLQSKRVVKAQELAERFEISLRTVYRDIRSLEEAGIPIIGEAGIGYSIMDGYRLPPIMFTKEEATAFMVAEKIVEKYTDAYNSEQYTSAMYKIRAVLRSAEKEFLEDVDRNILVLGNTNQPPSEADHSLQTILTCINDKVIIDIVYKSISADEPTQRSIEPIGMYLQNNYWYLIAYCRLKNDYRTFRTDRILHLNIARERYRTKHPDLNDYLKKISKESDLQTVVILVKKTTAKYLVTQKYYFGFVSETEKGDSIEMTFLTASLEGFAKWFLMIAPNAQIIKPLSIKERLKTLLNEISATL